MKKYSIIYLSVFISICAKSQGYRELIKDGNKWNILHEMIATCNCGDVRTYSLTISNDTLISSLNYKKVNCEIISANDDGSINKIKLYAAGIREDIDKQIVYVRYPNKEEQLLYTFNSHVGDTILIKDVYKDQWTDSKTVRTIKKIEQYNNGDNLGKKITVCDTTYSVQKGYDYGQPVTYNSKYEIFSDDWYEGIGSMKCLIDLNHLGIQAELKHLQLLCFWNNSTLTYHQEKYTECIYASHWTGINDISEKKVIIYPNPTNGKLLIDTNLNVSLIQIYNTEGNKMTETQNKNIDISSYPNGLYFVKIHSESGFMKVYKIIKHE